MRRILIYLPVFLLLLTLCGCNRPQSSTPTTPTAPTATVPIFEESPQVKQQPMIAASLPISQQDYTAQDGTVLIQHIYQNLELIVPDQDVADAIIIDFLNRTDKGHTSAEALRSEASEVYASGDFRGAFLSQITFEPMRLDRSVFSLIGNAVTHKGYAHPEVTAESVTYDLATGSVLTISDILQPEADFNTLYEPIIAALLKQADTTTFYEGYENTVADLLINPTNWYFSENGLVFYYSPYEIAPYSSGVITAEIEYDLLTGILDDAYFPAESDITNGQLLAEPLETENVDQFSQIAELVCSDNSNQVALYTDGLLENLRIVQSRGNGEYTVFLSPHITPGDAIVIYLSPNDNFRICYHANGEPTTKTLSLSSDGTLQLTD